MGGFTKTDRRGVTRFLAPLLAGVLVVGGGLGIPDGVRAQGYDELEARIWMSAGESPVLRRGDRTSLFYRATTDAYVAIFHVDTDGIVRLLHPRVPDEDHYVRRGITYRLRFDRSGYWYVDDYPGVGYFFIVASWEPMDFSSFRYSHFGGGWDLANVGRRVYQDPYLAMDDFVAALVPDWQNGGYALDFVEYHVDRRFDYPRFLCYDCHRFRPYRSWNPYRYQCHSFRLIIHTDPYFYPVTRYRGTRVVYARPPIREQPRFAFKERARGEPATPIFQRSSETNLPGVAGAERRRSTADGGRSPDRSAVPRAPTPGDSDAPSADARRRGSGGGSAGRGGAVRNGVPPTVGREDDAGPGAPRGSAGEPSPRRPSDRVAPGRAAPDRDPPRPVLERRPPGRDPGPSSPRSSPSRPDGPSRNPDGRSRDPDARPSTPGARPSTGGSRPSTPGARPSAPSTRSRPSDPRGGTVEPRRSEPRRPQRSPAPRGRAPEPRQRTPDRPSPSTRSPSSGGRDRSPAARPRGGSSASPAPRGGGSRSGRTPAGRGRGRPPR